MANSFSASLANLITLLQNNAALTAFCSAKWGKTLTVKASYRKRAEIKAGDLPLILITRPRVEKRFQVGARDGSHTAYLYALFHQDDREKGPLELIEFEEKIDDALLSDPGLSGAAINTTPTESVNDEGKNHPSYCIVMELEIKHRR